MSINGGRSPAAAAVDLKARGDLKGAIASLRRACEAGPSPDLRSKLVAMLIEAGSVDDACEEALRTLETFSMRPAAHEALARALLARQDFGGAAKAFQTCAQLRATVPLGRGKIAVPVHHLLHTLDQFDYLGSRSNLPNADSFDVTGYAKLRAQLETIAAESAPDPAFVNVSGDDAHRLLRPPLIAPVLQREAQPLRADAPWADVDALLGTNRSSYAIVDKLLNPRSLAALQTYCLGATVWRHPYKFGYVGAFPEDGFLAEILFDIAAALPQHLPVTLAGLHLVQWWGFSYSSQLPGTDIHADDSDISLNLWITPDEANLDPRSGGLEIWNSPAPREWTFTDYNSGGDRVRRHLSDVGARSEIIPYAENRAVIFHGKLFHRSHDAHFRDGYENRRRNITFLFRRRGSEWPPCRLT